LYLDDAGVMLTTDFRD